MKRVAYITPAVGDNSMTAALCFQSAKIMLPTVYTSWLQMYTFLAPIIKEDSPVEYGKGLKFYVVFIMFIDMYESLCMYT